MEAFYSEGERMGARPRIEAGYARTASKKVLRKKLVALSRIIVGATGIFIGVEVLTSFFIVSAGKFLTLLGALGITLSGIMFRKGIRTLDGDRKQSRRRR